MSDVNVQVFFHTWLTIMTCKNDCMLVFSERMIWVGYEITIAKTITVKEPKVLMILYHISFSLSWKLSMINQICRESN